MYLKIWAVFFLYKEEIVVKFTVPLVLVQFYDFISIICLILKKLWTSQLEKSGLYNTNVDYFSLHFLTT